MSEVEHSIALTDSRHNFAGLNERSPAQLCVAFLNDHLAEGGAEHSMAKIINQMAEEEGACSLHLFLLEDRRTFFVSQAVRVQAFRKRFRTGAPGKFCALGVDAWRLARLVREDKLAAVCSFQHRSNLVNTLAKCMFGAPHRCIISERVHVAEYYRHKLFLGISRGPIRDALAWCAKRLIKGLYKRADVVTCNARDTKDCLVEQYDVPESQVVVIPNGYDADGILAKAAEPLPAEEQPLFSEAYTTVVHVGRLCKQKGQDFLLRAAAKLPDAERYQVVLIGNGPWLAHLQKLARSLGIQKQVHFLGYRQNPYPYIKNADCFALPSRYEGFPNALAEAMVCNVPVVAFDFKSGSDELLEGGRYGALIPLGDVDAFAEALSHHREPSWREFTTETDCARKYAEILLGQQSGDSTSLEAQ